MTASIALVSLSPSHRLDRRTRIKGSNRILVQIFRCCLSRSSPFFHSSALTAVTVLRLADSLLAEM